MANKMLIDAAHPEETRVVVLRGNRVEEFDFEAASKKQLRGNIYLAKVTRVEPSLQAAFIEYGGNRHGFLAFAEIHPDYYQIPVADRLALLEEEARQHRDEEEEESRPRRSRRSRRSGERQDGERNTERGAERRAEGDEIVSELAPRDEHALDEHAPHAHITGDDQTDAGAHGTDHAAEANAGEHPDDHTHDDLAHDDDHHDGADEVTELGGGEAFTPPHEDEPAHADLHGEAHHAQDMPLPEAHPAHEHQHGEDDHADDEDHAEEEHVEQIGGDALEEFATRAPRLRRQYKIQEVIKRRQVLLVQVVKEERGNKGAALTTYLSLAGRYSVLMPNTARGGGISRKITDHDDRKRLKAIASTLDVPEGMGVILRTAGAARTSQEVTRDFEYLLRMWETVREITLKSSAPSLVYEEGSLIKRAIRDLYNKDVEEILVAGEEGYREAHDFMRMLMPSHTRNVIPYRDPQPLFARMGVEAQLDSMFSNQVTLKSGGYLVINQTEALVAIDVNSGRSTREHNIEDTALRTNLEAADEVARQLRLRDLAGLIVVDFIDMEEHRNNRAVERRIKDALKNDRARIQVGRISHFGLLEMSRQRIRTGVFEGSSVICPHCAGAGSVRSTASIALHVLRVLEDALIKSAAYNITVRSRSMVALYMLNQKRGHLRELEERFGVSITVMADDTLTGTTYHAIERGDLAVPPVPTRRGEMVRIDSIPPEDFEDEEIFEAEGEEADGALLEADEAGGEGPLEGESEADMQRRRRRRRRRRGRGADRESSGVEAHAPQPSDDALAFVAGMDGALPTPGPVAEGDRDEFESDEAGAEGGESDPRRRRRRSRRGGRNRNGSDERGVSAEAGDETPALQADERRDDRPSRRQGGSWVLKPEERAAAAAAHLAHEDTPLAAAPAESFKPAAPAPAPAPEQKAAPDVKPAEPKMPDLPEAPAPEQKRTGWWGRAKATFGGS